MNIRIGLALCLVLSLWSCGPAPLNGHLAVSGSFTLTPLMSRTVNAWKKEHPDVDVQLDSIGSDAGFERLTRYSDADIAMMSRPLNDKDRTVDFGGKHLLEVPVAWDAVCLVVPAHDDLWVAGVSSAEAVVLLTKARSWSDIRRGWPSSPIHRFALGPNSGTADVLSEGLLEGNKELLFQAPDVQASEDDHIVGRGVAAVSGSVGYLGWSTYLVFRNDLRPLAVDGVEPSPQSIRTGNYRFPRQLWLVTTREAYLGKPEIRSLVHFLFEHYDSLEPDRGLVPLSPEDRAQVLQTLSMIH